MADQEVLHRVLRKFARTMAGSYDISDNLHELAENALEVFGAAAAGVSLWDGDVLRFISATSDAAVEAEEAQERLQTGPCLRSLEEHHPVAVPDIRDHEDEWPVFSRIVEHAGFLSILGLPLVLGDRKVGALNVYAAQPVRWTEPQISTGVVLSDIAAAYILNASELARAQRTAEQLQTALDSRVIIEQAKGKIAGELGVSTEEAFRMIRHHARSTHATLRATCHAVLDEGAGAIQPPASAR